MHANFQWISTLMDKLNEQNWESIANDMLKFGEKKLLTLAGDFPPLMYITISGGFSFVNEFFFLTKLAAKNPPLMVISISGAFSPANLQEHNFF